MKKYYIFTDDFDIVEDYLDKREIYYTSKSVAGEAYLIVYTGTSRIKGLTKYAKRNRIWVSISTNDPSFPPFVRPFMLLSIPGRKSLRIEKAYLKYLASKPKEPIMTEDEFFRKHWRRSRISLIERQMYKQELAAKRRRRR